MSATTIRIQATEAQLQAFEQQCEVTELMLAQTLCHLIEACGASELHTAINQRMA